MEALSSSSFLYQKQNKPNDLPSKTTTISTSTTARTTSMSILPLPKSIPKIKAKSSLQSTMLNSFDNLIKNVIDPPIRSSIDPTHILSDNFAPVDELLPTECPIEGLLPPCLNGAYIRNGPNPQYLPQGPYHFFEGDGMLHSLLIAQGRATFCSRYVKTYKYLTELDAGSPIFPNIFSGFNNGLPSMVARGALSIARVLCGQYDPSKGIGVANVSLAFFGNRLFALGDSDLPYQVWLNAKGDIETIGRYDFDGKLQMNMTSHPKIDGETSEVFALRCGLLPPFVTLLRFDATDTKLEQEVPISSITRPTFIHDLAITKKYILFTDIQFGMDLKLMAKVPRIGVISRYAKDESAMRWFDVPGLTNVHTINAWDEDDGNSIVVILPNIIPSGHSLERVEYACVEKVTINLKTGLVSRLPISTMNLEYGVINPSFLGKKNKFGYLALGNFTPKISGVVKLDWSGNSEERMDQMVVGRRMFGSGCYGGEPFFVPKENAEEEDDGYVVTYVHDENMGESRFLVLDAKSSTLDIVASVKLPRRVPYGFHGLFISESDLRKQIMNGTTT